MKKYLWINAWQNKNWNLQTDRVLIWMFCSISEDFPLTLFHLNRVFWNGMIFIKLENLANYLNNTDWFLHLIHYVQLFWHVKSKVKLGPLISWIPLISIFIHCTWQMIYI